jgi:hypothetical protein
MASYVCFAPQLPQKLAVAGILAPQLMQNFVSVSDVSGGGCIGGVGAGDPQLGQNL